VVSWYIRFLSQDIDAAKLVGKLVAFGSPLTPPLFMLAPR